MIQETDNNLYDMEYEHSDFLNDNIAKCGLGIMIFGLGMSMYNYFY
jgi:hypothetical protein